MIPDLASLAYLQLEFSEIARGQAKNPNHKILQFAALLSQSGITFDHLCLVQLLQNLPQYFRRDHVADSIFDYLDYFADHVADVFGLFGQNLVADVFLMKIVDVETIQDQICMFQDSVPAGSYNDPFLSSVISMVAPTWCHGAI